MFYCNTCAEKFGWQPTFFKSVGKCESCGTQNVECSDRPSSQLPMPKKDIPKIGLLPDLNPDQRKKVKVELINFFEKVSLEGFIEGSDLINEFGTLGKITEQDIEKFRQFIVNKQLRPHSALMEHSQKYIEKVYDANMRLSADKIAKLVGKDNLDEFIERLQEVSENG